MPRIAKIKIGDRVYLKDSKEKFGVVVWKPANKKSNVHWDVPVIKNSSRSIRDSRGIYDDSLLKKAKPTEKVEVDNA